MFDVTMLFVEGRMPGYLCPWLAGGTLVGMVTRRDMERRCSEGGAVFQPSIFESLGGGSVEAEADKQEP